MPSRFGKYVTQPALALVMLIALALIGAFGGNEPGVRSADPGAKTIAIPLVTPGDHNPCPRRGYRRRPQGIPPLNRRPSLPAAMHTPA